MKTKSYIAAEFPDDLTAIQRLRSENMAFGEICDDLELLGRDLALFSKAEKLRNTGACLDVQESYQALRQELAELLLRNAKSAADEM